MTGLRSPLLRTALVMCAGCLHHPSATVVDAAPTSLRLSCPDGVVTRARPLLDGAFVAVEYKPRQDVDASVSPYWVRLYNSADGASQAFPIDGGGAIDAFAMLPDGTLLLSDGQQVRGVVNGATVFTLPARELTAPYAPALRALPTGTWLATHDAASVALIDGAGRVLLPNDPATRRWTVSDDGERLAVARWVPERRAFRLDLHDGRTGALLSSHDAGPNESYDGMLFSPDHQTLVVHEGSWGELSLRDGTTGALQHHLGYTTRAVSVPLGFTPAGDLVVASGLGGVELWDLATRRMTWRAPWAHDGTLDPLPETCIFDDERFACPAVEPTQVVFASPVRPPYGALLQVAVMSGEPGPVRPMGPASLAVHGMESSAISPDGTRLIALMQSERHAEVQTWDLAKRELLRIVPVPMPAEYQANFKLNADASAALLVTHWRASVTYDASMAPDIESVEPDRAALRPGDREAGRDGGGRGGRGGLPARWGAADAVLSMRRGASAIDMSIHDPI